MSNPEKILQEEFIASIKKFIDYRSKHGGILLPNAIMIDDAFLEASYETGLRERPQPKYVKNGSILLPNDNQ